MSWRVLAGAVLLMGCKTMPHHSNTMFFGTTTTLGVKVNAATTSSPTPQATVGYDRTEALVMPLLGSKSFSNDGTPTPCTPPGESCMFTGIQGTDKDTYSVLATFKGDASGRVNTNRAETGVGVAQYFSSGHAAIALAKKAGAAAVSTGKAAEASATPSEAQQKIGAETEEAHAQLIELVKKDSDAEVARKMKVVDQKVFFGIKTMEPACPNQADCLIALTKHKKTLRRDVVKILANYK